MGTNYYVKIKDAGTYKAMLAEMTSKNDFFGVYKMTNCVKYGMKVHIGKSSGGWKFVFNHNDRVFYDLTRASLDLAGMTMILV